MSASWAPPLADQIKTPGVKVLVWSAGQKCPAREAPFRGDCGSRCAQVPLTAGRHDRHARVRLVVPSPVAPVRLLASPERRELLGLILRLGVVLIGDRLARHRRAALQLDTYLQPAAHHARAS